MNYQCTVCGAHVGSDMIVYMDHTEKHVVDLIKHDHPEWTEKNGICRKCSEYYHNEIQGSVFKDASCALRIRKGKTILTKVKSFFGVKS